MPESWWTGSTLNSYMYSGTDAARPLCALQADEKIYSPSGSTVDCSNTGSEPHFTVGTDRIGIEVDGTANTAVFYRVNSSEKVEIASLNNTDDGIDFGGKVAWGCTIHDANHSIRGYFTSASWLQAPSSGFAAMPSGNHFEATNLNSTDIRTDVPTDSFCVMSPIDKGSGVTLSEGNLKAVCDTSWDNVRGTMGATSGKFYYEVIGTIGASTRWNAGVDINQKCQVDTYNDNTGSIVYSLYDGRIYDGAGSYSSATQDQSETNARIGVAVDIDAGKVWFRFNNGSWELSGGDPTSGSSSGSETFTAGSLVQPLFAGYGATFTVYFQESEWTDTAPTDYGEWKTSRLGTPVIKPAEHFNSLVYQGASPSDKAVTGVGFQPDLVWIKARTQTYNHAVYDSLRGATKELHTNTTDSEDTDSNGLKTFDSDGFTVGSDGDVGDPTGTRISWNWKAHQTPTSTRTTYTVKVEDSGGDAWDSSGSFLDGNNFPSVYMEIWENRNGSLVSLGKVAVSYYDSAGNTNSDLSEQTYELKCVDLNAITVKWHYDTSGDGNEYDYPNSYNDYLNEQKITILDGSTSEWTTNNHSNDDGGTDYNYSPPTGWANGDTLKSATTSYNGSDTATLTSGSSPVEKYNAAAGLSIITYSGNGGSDGDTQEITHSLGAEPEFIIAKSRDSSSTNGTWNVYHKHAVPYSDSGYGTHAHLHLNENWTAYQLYYDILIPKSGSENTIINTVYDSSDGIYTNEGGVDYVMYAWAPVEGYSKFGTYTGNGSADGAFIYLGFRPAFFMLKRTDSTGEWWMYDSKRDGYNVIPYLMMAQSSAAESSPSSSYYVDFVSNGVKLRNGLAACNGNGNDFIYAAFSEQPFSAPSNAR